MWEVENKPHKLIVMSGPTQCGKTRILKSIKAGKTHTIRACSHKKSIKNHSQHDDR